MKAIRLKVSDLEHPIGIDDLCPRFTWNCEGGIKQTAYRVIVKLDNEKILFDTGKILSSHMYCKYDGLNLSSRMYLIWQVGLWDENDVFEWSEESYFEMGLLNSSDWKAKWIHGIDTDKKEHLPVDYYRKIFRVKEAVKRARMYITALGVYTAFVNGQKVSSILAPGCTEYNKRLYYQTYDITNKLNEHADCELVFSVADGWYKGKLGADQTEFLFGTQTKLLVQVEIEYISGQVDIIGSDESFRWSNDGPVRFADLKDGEVVDSRLKPTFSKNAVAENIVKKIPTASNAPLISEHECFEAKILHSPSGKIILDFGQNMAGYIKFNILAPEGTKILIHLFETLDCGDYSDISLSFPEGAVETVKQQIVYIASGKADNYVPSFFYSGFRYAWVEGLEKINPKDFKAVAIYSDIDYRGSFECSNPLINKFVENTIWSMKSNFVDIPTDCPQREKSGWTGDAPIFCRTAEYFADTKAFFRKWLKDVKDCQRENGMVLNVNPCVLPEDTPMDIVNGSCGWADAAIIVPYTLWIATKDENIIIDNYDLMLGWRDYVINLCNNKSMFSLTEDNPFYAMKPIYEMYALPESKWNKYIPEYGIHWGEWSVPEEEQETLDSAAALIRPKQEVTCAYTHYSMRLLTEMLEAIGKKEEAKICKEYAEGSLSAYHEHWIKDGIINTTHMAELVRPIALGLADDVEKKNISSQLNEMVISRDYKIGTGFLSTGLILQALAENGFIESAYKMLEQEKTPGWLSMVLNGATTVWESYDCYDGDKHPLAKSFNHYSLGAVCGFLFDTVCGIKICGENRFLIEPKPGGTIKFAKAKTLTTYGEVVSKWIKEKDGIHYIFRIPSNTVAEIIFPDGRKEKIDAGVYDFFCTA